MITTCPSMKLEDFSSRFMTFYDSSLGIDENGVTK